MKLSRTLPISLTLSLLLAACGQQATTTPEAAAPAPTSAQAQTNAALHTFAKQLATTLTEPGVRSLIAQQTALKFNGDTEALYATLASQATGKGTFAQAMSSGLGTQSLNALTAQIPRLHVAVRGGAWDPTRTTPWVAVAPQGGDEFAPVVAYDAQGRAHQLNGRTTPEMPVVVVGVNERTDNEGNVLQAFSMANPASPPLSAQGTYQVRVVAATLIDDKEPWTLGNAEVMLIAKGTGLFYHGGFTLLDDSGDYLVFNRLLGTTTSDVKFYWYEDDGASLDFEAEVKGVGLGVKIDNDDDFLGSILMGNGYFEGGTDNKRDLGAIIQWTD